jgi:hypothetical protein
VTYIWSTGADPEPTAKLATIFGRRDNQRMGQAADPRAKPEADEAHTFERACPICRKDTTHAFLVGSFVCVECFPEVADKAHISRTSGTQPRS